MTTSAAHRPAPHADLSALLSLLQRAVQIGLEPSLRNTVLLSTLGLSFAVLLLMTAALLPGQVYGWEVDIVRWVQGLEFPSQVLLTALNRATNWNTPMGAAVITSVIAALWLARQRIESLIVALTVPLHVIANFPKALVDRERPNELIDGVEGLGGMKSFPSGHAEFAVTFYGIFLYLALLHVSNRYLKAALVTVWMALLLLVGLARMEIGKHWPLDIVAGYIIGVGLLSGLVWLHSSLSAARREEATPNRR